MKKILLLSTCYLSFLLSNAQHNSQVSLVTSIDTLYPDESYILQFRNIVFDSTMALGNYFISGYRILPNEKAYKTTGSAGIFIKVISSGNDGHSTFREAFEKVPFYIIKRKSEEQMRMSYSAYDTLFKKIFIIKTSLDYSNLNHSYNRKNIRIKIGDFELQEEPIYLNAFSPPVISPKLLLENLEKPITIHDINDSTRHFEFLYINSIVFNDTYETSEISDKLLNKNDYLVLSRLKHHIAEMQEGAQANMQIRLCAYNPLTGVYYHYLTGRLRIK